MPARRAPAQIMVDVEYVVPTDPFAAERVERGWRKLFELLDRVELTKECRDSLVPGAGAYSGASPSPSTASAVPTSSAGDRAPNRRAPHTPSAEPPAATNADAGVMASRMLRGRRSNRRPLEEHPVDAA